MGLDPSAELLVQAFDGVGGPRRLPLCRIEPGEGEEPGSGLFQAIGDRLAFQPPLAEECLAPLLHLDRGVGVDHVTIVVAQFLVHVLRSMGQQVAVLVNGCIFRGHAPTDSDLMRPPVPISSAHRFRGIRPAL